jgi:hypothetical protein
LLFYLLSTLVCAQVPPLNYDTQQEAVVNTKGFYPFSAAANQIFKESLAVSAKIGFINTNLKNDKPLIPPSFLPAMFFIAPAADGKEVGPRQFIWKDTAVILNYQNAPKNSRTYGISIVPFISTPSLTLELQPFANPDIKTVVCSDSCVDNLNKWCVLKTDSYGNKTCGKCNTTYGNACACKP